MKYYETKQNKKRNICILTVVVPSQVYIIVKTHQIIYLNWVQFIVYKVVLNKVFQVKKKKRIMELSIWKDIQDTLLNMKKGVLNSVYTVLSSVVRE